MRAIMICAVAGAMCGVAAVAHTQSPAPVAPPAAIAAARAAMKDTVHGADLRVVLLTAGPGVDEVWDRFGHSLLWIINERTDESQVWNWGIFNHNQPWFITRFLLGRTRYLMDSGQVGGFISGYRARGREVVAQDLVLTPGQRAALDALARTNVLGEDQFYRYDYFVDNCSTRLRDALDIVLDGAIGRTLGQQGPEVHTLRSETLRLVQGAPFYFLGMDLALGVRTDVPLTPWQLSYIPMRLRDALRAVTVRDEAGALVPLVRNERVIVPAVLPPVPDDYRGARSHLVVLAGAAVLAIVIAGLGMLGAHGVPAASGLAITLGVAVHTTFGALASLIVFMWFFTKHTFWAWNQHLLLVTPLSLVIAAALPFARRNLGHRRLIAVYHLLLTGIALVLVVGTLVWWQGRPSPAARLFLVWAAVSCLLHMAVGSVVGRLRARTNSAPPLA